MISMSIQTTVIYKFASFTGTEILFDSQRLTILPVSSPPKCGAQLRPSASDKDDVVSEPAAWLKRETVCLIGVGVSMHLASPVKSIEL